MASPRIGVCLDQDDTLQKDGIVVPVPTLIHRMNVCEQTGTGDLLRIMFTLFGLDEGGEKMQFKCLR